MTGNDAEPTLSATGEQGVTGAEQRWGQTRQRAADLFSPHRYRALQLSLFERKTRRAGAPEIVPVDAVVDAASGGPSEAWDEDPQALDRFAPVPLTGPAPLPGEVQLDYSGHDASTAELTSLAEQDSLAPAPEAIWVSSNGEWPEGESVAWDAVPQTEVVMSTTSAPGRNLRMATVVGLGLLAAALVAAWLHPIAFAILLYAFACGAVIEWKRALSNHGRHIPLVPLLGATVGMGVATWFAKPEGLVVALLVGCAGVVAWRIGDERVENTLADALAGVLTLLWIPFLASFLFLLEVADDGWQRVFIIVLAVVGNDTGGLVAGMTLGRHKLLPRVSPAKTWEGAVGGVLLGTAAASVAAYFFFDGAWYIGAAVGAAAAVAAIIGDLAESALKRDIRVKDMSSVIPGHGGILDRIDSLLFAAPVGYVVFALFLGTLGGGGL